MSDFATVQDIIDRYRPLLSAEQTRAAVLLSDVSNHIRFEASRENKDYDALVAADSNRASVAKQVTVDVVYRILRQSMDGDPMTQESQAANGYSWSGTFAIPGGGIANAFLRKDWAALGLHTQKYGVIEWYGQNQG